MIRVLRLMLFAVSMLASAHASAQSTCTGRWINPISDICWSCLFPISIFNIPIFTFGQEDWSTGAPAFCWCQRGPISIPGVNIGFNEPIRLVEVVRHPGCFPALAGLKIDLGIHSPAHAQSKRDSERGDTNGVGFYQVHWYTNPILFVIQAVIHFPCLDTANGFDLAYMTEFDPLWDDSESTFILNPDASLFTSVIASAACAVDCVQASIGFGNPALYWCAGCQGRMFPLTGWVGGRIGHIQASALLAQRFTMKLHRQGMMRAAWGQPGQCGDYPMPIMDKRAYKLQMVLPFRVTDKVDGRCCYPYGRTTQLWQVGKTVPMREDYVYQVWQRKDCCFPARM
jgi:conjugal transfer pilus assembly protein TraU